MNRTRIAIGVGVTVLVLIGVRLLLPVLQGERLAPRQRTLEMFRLGKEAFENEDVDTLMSLVSDDFNWGGMDARRLRLQLVNFFKNAEQPRVEYTPPTIEVFGGRVIARTQIKLHWRDSGPNEMDLGPIEIELRQVSVRKWLVIPSEDLRVVRMEGMAWDFGVSVP